MLQQTTVAAVEPRYREWMRRFPTLRDLAQATEQEVLSAWQGLGYYARARRLHAAARSIVQDHGGLIPKSEEALLSLPGIGTYTAAAIMAFAHDRPAAVLDTNIARVLARWSNQRTPVDSAAGRKELARAASAFAGRRSARKTVSALMDLGAMICRPKNPGCNACPLRPTCAADDPSSVPRKEPRAVTLPRRECRAWIHRNGRLFLEHSAGPLWKGLWILPDIGSSKVRGRPLARISYHVTRYRVTMSVHAVAGQPGKRLRGFTEEELRELPMPSPHRRAIAATALPRHTQCTK